MGSLRNGFPEAKISYWESFYSLRFLNQDQLDHFHSMGYETNAPELIMGAEPWSDDDEM
jgi:hypothetical protein